MAGPFVVLGPILRAMGNLIRIRQLEGYNGFAELYKLNSAYVVVSTLTDEDKQRVARENPSGYAVMELVDTLYQLGRDVGALDEEHIANNPTATFGEETVVFYSNAKGDRGESFGVGHLGADSRAIVLQKLRER